MGCSQPQNYTSNEDLVLNERILDDDDKTLKSIFYLDPKGFYHLKTKVHGYMGVLKQMK